MTAALVNGTGRTSNDTDAFKDQMYQIAYQTPEQGVSMGGSYYYGQINVPDVTAICRAGPPGRSPAGSAVHGPQEGAVRGGRADLDRRAARSCYAEYVGGLYEQRSLLRHCRRRERLTTVYAKDNHVDGYYAAGGWTFGQTGNHPLTLCGQYDVLRRGEGKANGFNRAAAARTRTKTWDTGRCTTWTRRRASGSGTSAG